MNITFVADLENHDVYLINNEKVSFYLNIPKKEENTNITIDVKYKKKENLNDIVSYYQQIDNYNITLVIPMFKVSEEENEFKKQSNLLSSIINCSYKILTNSKIIVKDNINIIKHSAKSDFVDFFVNKFSSRVRYLSLDFLVQEEVPYNKVSAANMSFVIGRPELELTIKDDDMSEIINETKEKENKQITSQPKLNFATSGYVSYYLLGFLTAVVTLLMLTLLIK